MKLILLIDDEEQIRISFGAALRNKGYRVIEAESGDAGLELARQQLPDLILTDINMPGKNGQVLLSQIRADPELGSRQVVLMTGRPDLVPPRTGMEQGADDFLVKPISFQALISCVEARLKRADVHWRVADRIVSKLSASTLAHVPHEFITPLAGILGLSEILRSDFKSLSEAEMNEYLADIHLSAIRLHRTVRNYLLMLELDAEPAGRAELPPALTEGQLRECLNTAVSMVIERQGRKGDVTMTWEKMSIRAHPSDLTKIVEELLDNALKFSRPGTPVKVSLDSNGILSITDSGRGMTTEEIEQIATFQQFERKKYEQQGLGLGLVIVQKLAIRNGATFSLVPRAEAGMEANLIFT
jgi:two-component system sensor histidine kinase/response regulator